MKRGAGGLCWALLLSGGLHAASLEAERYLSPLKLESLELLKEQNEEDSQKLLWQWVNPLNLTYSESRNYDYSPSTRTKSYAIGVNQPIFKSGAIYHSIRYAKSSKRYGEAEISLKERELIVKALNALFTLQKLDHEIQKQKLLVENAAIDVERKKEQFQAGFVDSGTLDNAILDKNQAEIRALELEDSRLEALKNLSDVSEIRDYRTIELPRFYWIDKESYLTQNLELERLRWDEERQGAKYKETVASFLPQISLQADYYHQHNQNTRLLSDGWSDYKTAGVVLSIPFFDLTMSHQVQSAKINHLKASLERADAKRSEENLYERQKAKLNILGERKRIASEDLKLYNSLLQDSIDRSAVGDLTEYDVKTMQNSKRSREMDIQIYELEEQILFLDLYAKIPEAS